MEVRSYEGDGYRVSLSFYPDHGWFVEVHHNGKRSTACGPVGKRKAQAIFAMACQAKSYVGTCVTVHNNKIVDDHSRTMRRRPIDLI